MADQPIVSETEEQVNASQQSAEPQISVQPAPLSPELAQRLSQSEQIKDENLKAQLQSLAAPLMTPAEQSEVAEDTVPQFSEQLTGVPAPDTVQGKAELDLAEQTIDPTNMSREQRAQYQKTVLDEKDARMREKIIAGESTPEEKLEFAKRQQKLAEQAQAETATDDASRQAKIKGKYDMYLEKLSEVQENNKLFAAQGLPLEPEPNIIEFMDKADMDYALKSGMDIPEAAALKAAEEVDVYEDAEDLAAQKEAQRKVANEQKAAAQVQVEQQQKAEQKQAEAKTKVAERQAELRTEFTSMSDLFENASTGRKFTAGLSIVLGGIAQGLMGGGNNPAVAMLEQTFSDNLEKQKFAFDQYTEKLSQAAALTPDPLKQQKLRNAQLEGQKKSLEIEEKLITKELSKVSGDPLTPEQAAAARRTGDKGRLVVDSDGNEYLATNNNVAMKLTDFKNETEPAIQQIDDIIAMMGTYNKLNPLDPRRREMESRLVAISGKLRIPLTGPGVLTDAEYKRLREAVGNPNRILTLNELELASLNAVKSVLKTDLKSRYRNAGINLKLTPEERAIEEIMKNPKIARGQKQRAITLMKMRMKSQ